MALLMARLYTGSFDVLALRNSYHGSGLIGHGTWTYNSPSVRHRAPVPGMQALTLLGKSGLGVVHRCCRQHSLTGFTCRCRLVQMQQGPSSCIA